MNALPFLLSLQVATSWNIRVIDVLITVLLTVLIGISTWALRTVLTHADRFEKVEASLGKISQQVWGVDGRNGHTSELRDLNKSIGDLERIIARLIRRVDRIDFHLKLPEWRDRREDVEAD